MAFESVAEDILILFHRHVYKFTKIESVLLGGYGRRVVSSFWLEVPSAVPAKVTNCAGSLLLIRHSSRSIENPNVRIFVGRACFSPFNSRKQSLHLRLESLNASRQTVTTSQVNFALFVGQVENSLR